MKLKTIALSGAFLLACFQINADVRPVPVSLKSTISQDIGKTHVSIEYSRPNAKGRAIFGDLVPFDEVWRTGANRSTNIKFNTTVSINGYEIAAGEYSLFTIPGKESWTVIINSVPNQFGAFEYTEITDVFRFEVQPTQKSEQTETLEIAFKNVADNKADIEISWNDTTISFPISVTEESNHAEIMAEIKRCIIESKELTWQNYGEAARYYVKHDVDLELAAHWYSIVNVMHPDAYWLFHEHASLLKKLNRIDEAIEVATDGMNSAKRQNDENGENWLKGFVAELKGS